MTLLFKKIMFRVKEIRIVGWKETILKKLHLKLEPTTAIFINVYWKPDSFNEDVQVFSAVVFVLFQFEILQNWQGEQRHYTLAVRLRFPQLTTCYETKFIFYSQLPCTTTTTFVHNAYGLRKSAAVIFQVIAGHQTSHRFYDIDDVFGDPAIVEAIFAAFSDRSENAG